MSTVKKGGPVGPTDGGAQKAEAPSRVGAEIMKVQSAVDPTRKSGSRQERLSPHRVKVAEEIAIAIARHHRVEMEEEARRHRIHEGEGLIERSVEIDADEDEDEDLALEGINLDDDRGNKRRRSDEDDAPHDEDGEDAVRRGHAAAEHGFATKDGAERYFRDLPADRLGDLSLVDPEEIREQLGPSVRFAQHAMLLGADRFKNGAPRHEILSFMASLYVGVPDRAYANKALREFGPATGILDIYPLEVIDHLLEHVPSFFTKVERKRFLTSSPDRAYRGHTGTPLLLTFDPALRIRGFAIKGGPRPGYLFEPGETPGTYRLTFQTSGKFEVLLSAISREGSIFVDDIEIEIEGEAASLEDASTMKRERAHQSELQRQGEATGAAGLKLNIPRRI